MSLGEAVYGPGSTGSTRVCQGRNCPHTPTDRVYVRAGGSLTVCQEHKLLLQEAGEIVSFIDARQAAPVRLEEDRPRALRYLHAGGAPPPGPRHPPAPPRLAPEPVKPTAPRRSPPARAGVQAPSAAAVPPPRAVLVPPPEVTHGLTPDAAASLEAPAAAVAEPGGTPSPSPPPTEASMVTPTRPSRSAGLCPTPGCKNVIDSRGICGTCRARAKRLGLLDDPQFPSGPEDLQRLVDGWAARLAESARSSTATKRVERVGNPNPHAASPAIGAAVLCKVPGCTRPGERHGWCDRDRWRIDRLHLDPATVTGEQLAQAWEDRPRSMAAKPGSAAGILAPSDPEADEPLQKIRAILGCDLDGADEEVVQAANELKWDAGELEAERDRLRVENEQLTNRLTRLRSNLGSVLEIGKLVDDPRDDVLLVGGLQEVRDQVKDVQEKQVVLAIANDTLTGELRRYKTHLDDIRCVVLDRGWPLGDDSDSELTPQRLVREVMEELARLQAGGRTVRVVPVPDPLLLPVAQAVGMVDAGDVAELTARVLGEFRRLGAMWRLPPRLVEELRDVVADPLECLSDIELVSTAIERLTEVGTSAHPILRVCRSFLDASGRVVVRVEQDASGELPPIPMGALVALVPQPERIA